MDKKTKTGAPEALRQILTAVAPRELLQMLALYIAGVAVMFSLQGGGKPDPQRLDREKCRAGVRNRAGRGYRPLDAGFLLRAGG